MISFAYRYKCSKCGDKMNDNAHQYCVNKNLPDLCFEHQPDYVKKVLKQYETKTIDK